MTGLKISPVKICHVYKVLQYSNLLLSTIYLINVWKYIEISKNVSCNINTPASKSFVKDWDDGCDIIFYPDSKPAFCCLRCHPCLLVRLLWSFCFSSLLLQKKYNRFWNALKALEFVSALRGFLSQQVVDLAFTFDRLLIALFSFALHLK